MTTRPCMLLIALALVAGCRSLTPQAGTSEVEALERARFELWTKADTERMRTMLADDLLYCHADGRCQNKQELLADFSSGSMVYRKMDLLSFNPKRVGADAVLVNGKFNVIAESGGRSVEFQGIYTDVYVKRDGRWQLVSWQSTRLQ